MNLLQMSFAGAMLILAVIVIRTLAIHALPKKLFPVLWGIVLVRLLVPFSIPSAFSVYSLIGRHTSAEGAQTVGLPFDEIRGQMVIVPGSSSNPAGVDSVWITVWAAGAGICALVFAIAYWKCRQNFQTSLPVNNDFLQSWLNTHRLKRVITVRLSDRVSSPLTYGIIHPVILLPTSIDWGNTEVLQYVFAHEYVHIRRFDSAAKFVLTAAVCVHWFNPMVWAMYILANRDIELSCDEAVIRLFGENTKGDYARALIGMEEARSGFAPLCNNFCKNAIEERITAIMKFRKTSLFTLGLAVSVIFGATTAFATSAGEELDHRLADGEGNYYFDSDADRAIGALSARPEQPEYSDEEMAQIVADIESGKRPGYVLSVSDLEEGRVLVGFEVEEGADVTYTFEAGEGVNVNGISKAGEIVDLSDILKAGEIVDLSDILKAGEGADVDYSVFTGENN